jgi:hypothetical protein
MSGGTAAHFTVTASRIGAYLGSDALSLWRSTLRSGSVQPPPVVQEPTSRR